MERLIEQNKERLEAELLRELKRFGQAVAFRFQLSAFRIPAFQLFGLLTLGFPPPPFRRTITRHFAMGGTIAHFPIGRQVSLPGQFALPVPLESANPLGRGFECRIHLRGGTLDEAVTPGQRGEKKVGLKQLI